MKPTPIQHNGSASANSISRGRITRRQRKSLPGGPQESHGNHHAKCKTMNCNLGTSSSSPKIRLRQSLLSSGKILPGNFCAIQIYQGATIAKKRQQIRPTESGREIGGGPHGKKFQSSKGNRDEIGQPENTLRHAGKARRKSRNRQTRRPMPPPLVTADCQRNAPGDKSAENRFRHDDPSQRKVPSRTNKFRPARKPCQ